MGLFLVSFEEIFTDTVCVCVNYIFNSLGTKKTLVYEASANMRTDGWVQHYRKCLYNL